MEMINEYENEDVERSKVLRGRKLKVNLIIVSKNTGSLNIRDQIILQCKGIRHDRKKNLMINVNDEWLPKKD